MLTRATLTETMLTGMQTPERKNSFSHLQHESLPHSYFPTMERSFCGRLFHVHLVITAFSNAFWIAVSSTVEVYWFSSEYVICSNDCFSYICWLRLSRAGCISGYMVVTASSRFTSDMAVMRLSSITTSMLMALSLNLMDELYTPETYCIVSFASFFLFGRNINIRSSISRIPSTTNIAV